MVKSRYFWTSVAITAACSRFFTTEKWWELPISVVPGLIGFSIAGVAIFVSLGSDSLRSIIAGKLPGAVEESPFMSFMAMFTHFIVFQLLALISAIVAKALYEPRPITANPLAGISEVLKAPFWLAGGLCFTYAVLLCLALATEIYRLASMIDGYQTTLNADSPNSKVNVAKTGQGGGAG